MANVKILEQKQNIIDEITNKVKNSSSVVWFEYRGLNVLELMELRRKLRETDSELKIYKNTLTKRALDTLKIDLGDELNGPKAVAFGSDAVMPVKVISDFAKNHPALEVKVGLIDGEITGIDTLDKLAKIPSREGLLNMFASGLLEVPRNFAICVDLHRKNLEN